VLDLERRLRADAEYEVKVLTSNKKGASTTARVYVELLGDDEGMSSGEHLLRAAKGSAQPFKRGAEDVFMIASENLGELKALHVWHDNTGLDPQWHLKAIHVRKCASSAFSCRCELRCDTAATRRLKRFYAGPRAGTSPRARLVLSSASGPSFTQTAGWRWTAATTSWPCACRLGGAPRPLCACANLRCCVCQLRAQ